MSDSSAFPSIAATPPCLTPSISSFNSHNVHTIEQAISSTPLLMEAFMRSKAVDVLVFHDRANHFCAHSAHIHFESGSLWASRHHSTEHSAHLNLEFWLFFWFENIQSPECEKHWNLSAHCRRTICDNNEAIALSKSPENTMMFLLSPPDDAWGGRFPPLL